MEQNMSLIQAWRVIQKHFLGIVLLGIIAGAAVWATATFVMTPKYSANTQILVSRKSDNSTNNGAQYSDQQADIQMITTYKDIITNPVILNGVSRELAHPAKIVEQPAVKAKYRTNADGTRVLVRAAKPAVTRSSSAQTYNISPTQLKKAISISNQQNSQVFAVTVKATDPDEAARIANVTAQVFKRQIKSILSVNNVTIVSKAVANSTKISPRTTLLTAAGLILGLVLGLVIAFVRELTDRTVKDEAALNEMLGLTNLGHVTRISGQQKITKVITDVLQPRAESNSGRSGEPKHLSSRV